jgi:arylsulfatase A-like enzyme
VNTRHCLILLALILSAAGCQSPKAAAGGAKPGPGAPGASASQPGAPASQAAAAPVAGGAWDRAPGPEHPVFKLSDNRLLAHLIRKGGLVVPAGEPGFAKYSHFGKPTLGWQVGLKEGEIKVAVATRPVFVHVPLTAAQAEGNKLYLRASSPGPQKVRLKVNGAVASAQLQPGWQTVAIDVPAGALRTGESYIEITPGARLAVQWLGAGKDQPDDDPGALHDGQGGLLLPPGGGLAWYVLVTHEGMAVSAQVEAKGTCQVRVRALPSDGAGVERAGGAGAIRLDLTPLKRRVVRLEVLAEGAGCQGVVLKDGALTLPGPAPVVKYDVRPKNILFWLTDSTRADKMTPYNPKTHVEMPNMTAVAKKGVPFWGYSQGNESRASHGSLWTSNYVVNHKMYLEGMHLTQRLTHMARALKPSGLYTGCITANGYISKHWGFGEGWSFFRNNLHDGGGIMANDIARWGMEFITKNAAKPFFLYLGTIDGHVSWRAREPWVSKYDAPNGPYNGPYVKWLSGPTLEQIIAGKVKITERDKARVRAIYESALSFNDQHFGTVIAKLKETGHEDDTMVIINADHGDEFWEKGRVGHGGSIRQTMVQVPTIVTFPPLLPAGPREDENADAVDLIPTMCDALGIPIPKDAQGESLIPVAQGALGGYPRPSFASQYEISYAMRLSRWKLFVSGGKYALYDVVDDPGEDRDLWDARPWERRFLTDSLGYLLAYQAQWKKTRWGVASNQRPEFAADLEAGLRPATAKGEAGAAGAAAEPAAPHQGVKRHHKGKRRH